MKLNAVGVTSTNLQKTISFYKLLGFSFGEFLADEKHIESISGNNSAKLMIDTQDVVEDIIGEVPVPGNHSSFAIEYDSDDEIDEVVSNVERLGFMVVKAPWNAFWGQRYAIVQDPDGYKIDLYAQLKG